MKKAILSLFFAVSLVGFANAQSGKGYLKGFVKCGGIGNDGCVVAGATVVLRPIENWSKSTQDVVVETDKDGYFSTSASFGEYELIISAFGYDTYQTTVYLPSSKNLEWAVRLHKINIPVSTFSDSKEQSLFTVNSEFNFDIQNGDKIYQFYKEKNQKPPIDKIAEAVTHYTRAVRANPFNVEAYRKRAAARYDLFWGVNPFTIEDLQNVVALDPKDAESKARLAKYQSEYKKMYLSKECVAGRNLSAFEGNGTEARTQLTMDLDASGDDYDPRPALKDIACGANVNYVYKKDDREPLFWSVVKLKPELVIAMLEAGANPNATDKLGNTTLMLTLKDFINDKESGLVDDEYLEKRKISGNILILKNYGADITAKNLKGETVESLVKKANNVGIEMVAGNVGGKFFIGTWAIEKKSDALTLKLYQKDDTLTGEFAYLVLGKKSGSKILSSKITGDKAIIEFDSVSGGKGAVEITIINEARLHWKVVKKDETKAKFVTLQDEFLTR